MRALCLASRAAFFSFLLSSLSCFLLVSAMSNTFGVCVGEVRSVILLRKHCCMHLMRICINSSIYDVCMFTNDVDNKTNRHYAVHLLYVQSVKS